MTTLLTLDLSTSCTGWAVFNIETKQLISSGRLVPKVPGIHKFRYPKAALLNIKAMTELVTMLICMINPDILVIEEINRGISRLGQKSLDAVHFFILDYVYTSKPGLVEKTIYIDSNGKKGWRGDLGLKLSDKDKQVNAEIRLYNKRRKKSQKAPVIDYKVLAQRYVNVKFNKNFNVWENLGDNDECDAIALGDAFLTAKRFGQ